MLKYLYSRIHALREELLKGKYDIVLLQAPTFLSPTLALNLGVQHFKPC